MLSDYKSILIGVTYDLGEEEKPSSALPYGLAMAHQANARITALSTSVLVTVPSTVLPRFSSGLAGEQNRRLDALARAAAEQATRYAEAEGLVCTSVHRQLSYSALIDTFTLRARVSDLAVLDAERTLLSADRGLIEAALFHSGRPAVVVPSDFIDFKAGIIVVAWDGSARASRAVHDALPFLRSAGLVDVVSIKGEKDLSDMVPSHELVAHLACHGILAETTELYVEDGNAVGKLREYVSDRGGDMIVMGAFVRSWIRQITLGGFTRSLLDDCPVPLFLSH